MRMRHQAQRNSTKMIYHERVSMILYFKCIITALAVRAKHL
jgi:hypothetical protein